MFCTYCGTFLTWIMYLTDVIYIIRLVNQFPDKIVDAHKLRTACKRENLPSKWVERTVWLVSVLYRIWQWYERLEPYSALLAEHIGVTPSPLVVVIAACVLVCVSELLKRRWRNM